MMKTNLVAQRFAQAHQTYVQNAVAQQQVAHQLHQTMQHYLPRQDYRNILEIGCGSGFFTQLILEHYACENIFLNDLYSEVKQHFPENLNLSWCIGDIEQLELPQSLDLVMSCSALQWMANFKQLAIRIHTTLQQGGYFCFSSYAEQNLQEIKTLTGRGLDYQTLDQIVDILESIGFEIYHADQDLIQLEFDHPQTILRHLKVTGVNATAQGFRWTKTSLNQFYLNYQKYKDEKSQQYRLTYHPIFIIARKKS